eukprot:scaffold1192_cov179-Ochromonas_danica.AAC.8
MNKSLSLLPMSSLLLILLFLILTSIPSCSSAAPIPFKSSHESKGVVLLDAITFPKIIPPMNCDLMVLVVQKAQIGDYGTDSIRGDYFAFADFVQLKATGDEVKPVLFAQVIVNGAENAALARSLGMKDKFTHPGLFFYAKGSTTPIPYPSTEPFQSDSLLRFLNKHGDFYYKLSGTSKELDQFIEPFLQASSEKTRQNMIIHQVEEYKTTLTHKTDIEDAQYYIKIMENIQKKGIVFIGEEIKRLETMLSGGQIAIPTQVKLWLSTSQQRKIIRLPAGRSFQVNHAVEASLLILAPR